MKVVVADDCVEMRRLIRSVLAIETEIIECANGWSALQAVRDHAPDWVLLDINMPLLDGISAAQQMLKIIPETRIIFVTAHDEPRWRSRAAQVGNYGYVLKDSLEQVNQIMAQSRPPE